MLTTHQAAQLLGVSERRVQALVRDGAIAAQKVSGIWLISEDSIKERIATVSKKGGRPARGRGKSETEFTLMNREHEIAQVIYDSRRKEFTYMSSDVDEARAPIGLFNDTGNMLANFNSWWRGRGIPQTRHRLDALLNEAGVALPQELIQRNLGLSLSDHYWIRPIDSALAWEDANFFNNDFNQVSLITAEFVVDGKTAAAKPDNTSDGNLEKRWVCRNGKRLLLKGGTQYGQEPYNEVVATALHRRLLKRDDYVPYGIEGEGATALSRCANFLTDEEEFVPALYVERHLERDTRLNDYEHYLACCEALGAHAAASSLDRMIVCDDIIANHDRHHRNFGLIRNVESLECRPAPIFDSGSSLWCNIPTSQLVAGEQSFESKQFYASPAKQMLLVQDMSWFSRSKLEGFVDEALGILAKNEALASRLPSIEAALEWRVDRMVNIAEWS